MYVVVATLIAVLVRSHFTARLEFQMKHGLWIGPPRMPQCHACDGSVVMDSENLVVRVQFEVDERRERIIRRERVQLSDVTPRIGALFR